MLASVSLSGTELLIQGNPTDDTISLIGNTNSPEFTVSVAGEPLLTQTFQNDQITKVTVFAGDGDDFVANTLEVPTVIYGQGGNDTLRGGYADDIINGGDGNDDILGRTGNDVLNGQNDDDTISGGYGNDTITGGLGNDVLSGDQGDDQINGHSGNDVINGGVGADTLTGSTGNDSITGGDGDDNLNGGDGDDSLEGNQGEDTLVGETGNDFLSGGNGNDTLYGNDGNDELLGASGDDIIFGAGGDDIIEGGLGNDELWGQGDNDTLDGQGGDDYVNGGSGNDSLAGGSGADELNGFTGDDTLVGGTDNSPDRLRGGTGFDTFSVQGEIGNGSVDEVLDRFGMETFTGYAGPLGPSIELDGRTLSVVGSNGYDKYHIDDKFNDGTTIRIERFHSEVGSFATSDVDEIVVHLNAGNDQLYVYESEVSTPIRAFGGEGDDYVEGGNGNDWLSGGNGDDRIHGRGGDDVLSGNAGNDAIGGHDGDDEINGGEGNDLIGGGNGNDFIAGNEGDDTLYGDDDNDHIRGGLGNDTIYGGRHNDLLEGNEGDDYIEGDRDPDTIFGGLGNDVLKGEHGNDIIRGGQGDDYLHGGIDNDQLFGDAGADEIHGGADDDSLFAGTDIDVDQLWGDGGFDAFDFVDGIDALRHRDVNEATTATVAQSVDELASLTSEVARGTFSRSELTEFASSGDEVFVDGLNVITLGTKRFVFKETGTGFQMLGDFSFTLPVSTAASIAEARGIVANSSVSEALGQDLTVSLVPSSAVLSDAGSSFANFESAFVANGNGTQAVVGGATLDSSDQVVAELFDVSSFVTDLGASTLQQISDSRLEVNQGNGLIGALASLQSGTDTIVQSAITGLVSNSLVAMQPAQARVETVTIEINYHFRTLTASAAVQAEVNRIFQDLMTRNAKNDATVKHTLNIVWKRAASRLELDRLDLGYSGGAFVTGANPTKVTVAVHDQLLAGVPGQAAPGRFRAGLNPGFIQRLVALSPVPITLDAAVAAAIAHEIGLHAIGNVTDHYHDDGFIDARVGQVGGTFSPEARERIADRLDVEF